MVAEATLIDSTMDDPRRGHLTAEEAIDMADRAGAGRVVLVHFRAELRERIERACAARSGAMAGRPGLAIDVVAEGHSVTTGGDVEPGHDALAPVEGVSGVRSV